jgi:hypothetical protein
MDDLRGVVDQGVKDRCNDRIIVPDLVLDEHPADEILRPDCGASVRC